MNPNRPSANNCSIRLAYLGIRRIPLVIAMGGLILISGCSSSQPSSSSTPAPVEPPTIAAAPTNDPILGDPSHFDPFGAYAAVAQYAGQGLKLSGINIYYVRADGTLDLKAKYRPSVNYSFFQNMDEPPPDAPPVGAGGKLNEKWYQPIDVDIYAATNPREAPRVSRTKLTPTNQTQQPVAIPSCSLRDFWAQAIKIGAPENAVATIYYSAGGYSFRINDTSVNLTFNSRCQMVRGIGLTPEPTETTNAPVSSQQ